KQVGPLKYNSSTAQPKNFELVSGRNCYQRRSQLAASVSPNCTLAPAPEARLVGNSATLEASGTEKCEGTRPFEKINLSPDSPRSILIRSPKPIWPVAIRFDIGYTR